jgi:hypothetical protein
MRYEESDRKLTRLREAAERIAANLVELELDSGRQLLDASRLEGESAARWSAASAALTDLWQQKELLDGLLERAGKLRGSRRADELGQLLEGPSIELSTSDVPLAERGLLGTARVAQRCTPDELIARMSASFDEIKTAVSSIGAAWDTLVPKLDAARRQLLENSRLAAELGEEARADLNGASRSLAELSATATTDPLSLDPSQVDELARSLDAIRADLEQSASLKREFDRRMLAARELLEQLRTAEADAQAADAELQRKIAGPGPDGSEGVSDELEQMLSDVTDFADSGSWRGARQALEEWTARADAALTDAVRAIDAARSPVQARNQFRALLDAYQVKAKRLGLLEDPDVAALHARAQDVLYTAPTDLALAAQLVRRYQEAISGTQPTSEALS